MSRKRKAPKKIPILDPKYKSTVIPKLINSIMYDGKKTTAEKIIYDAIDKIKSKTKDEPLEIFNQAINNIKPTVEVRSRRVGGATYQVPVEVKSKRSQALALRWLVDASRKRKNKNMSDKIFNEIEKKIIHILETKVRPAVARDGGDIKFKEFVDGKVKVELQGSCSGCPSSTMTLKQGVQNLLTHYVPEVKEVLAV